MSSPGVEAEGDVRELPLPSFFHENLCSQWRYEPDPGALLAEAESYRSELQVRGSGSDRVRTHLLLVDLQRDFCLPQGSLFVGGRGGLGAISDTERIVRFIYRNLERITDITCTLDTHLPYQIFFPAFWETQAGASPPPHTRISAADIRAGRVKPRGAVAWWLCNGNTRWLERQVVDYCERLEAEGRYELYLWPPHCLLGSSGHALVGAVQAARLFHAYCRGSKCFLEVKGGNILTENYSAIRPEVVERHDGKPLAAANEGLVESLFEADRILIAGQAASHCVRATVEDLVDQLQKRGASADRLYLLEDCMSSVAVPDPGRPGEFLSDFTDETTAALESFAKAGVHIVRSTTPMSRWPGV